MSDIIYDLKNLQLSAGAHTVEVKAEVDGYEDSPYSNPITLTVYSISYSIVNGSASGESSAFSGESVQFTVTAIQDYYLPTSVTVTNATLLSYDSTTGQGEITNLVGNVTISGTCYPQYIKLDTPVIQLTNSVVSWGAISNASSYNLYINSTYVVEHISTTSFDLSTALTAAGAYAITVKAIGSGQYVDSDLSNEVTYEIYQQLTTPWAVMRDDGHTFVFTVVANASSYTLYADNNVLQTGISGASSYIDLLQFTSLSLGPHSMQIQAVGTGYYTNSSLSTAVTYTKTEILATPVITISGDILSWSAINNASSYQIFADSSPIQSVASNVTSYDLSQLTLVAGSHTIQLRAVGTGYYLSSDLSNSESYTYMEQLDAPTNVSMSGTDVTFNEVENAETYEFFVDGSSIGEYTIQRNHRVRINGITGGSPTISINGVAYGDANLVYGADDVPHNSTLNILDSYIDWGSGGEYNPTLYVDGVQVQSTDIDYSMPITSDIIINLEYKKIYIVTNSTITDPLMEVNFRMVDNSSYAQDVIPNDAVEVYSLHQLNVTMTAHKFVVDFMNKTSSNLPASYYVYKSSLLIYTGQTTIPPASQYSYGHVTIDITEHLQDGCTVKLINNS